MAMNFLQEMHTKALSTLATIVASVDRAYFA